MSQVDFRVLFFTYFVHIVELSVQYIYRTDHRTILILVSIRIRIFLPIPLASIQDCTFTSLGVLIPKS